jgi:hypothetical protein
MKIERFTIEAEVPHGTIQAADLLHAVERAVAAFTDFYAPGPLPYQGQITSEVSPNTQIGDALDWKRGVGAIHAQA